MNPYCRARVQQPACEGWQASGRAGTAYRQVRRDVGGAVVGEKPWPVDDLCLNEPRGLQCQVQRGGDILGLHRRAQLLGDDVA
jgi:hypothetical protein